MISKFKSLYNNKVLTGTIIVAIGSFIGSFFNYLFQIFLGRNLSIEEFGTFTTLLSLSVLIAIPATAFVNSLIKYVAQLKAKNDFKSLTYLFKKVVLSGVILGFILVLIINLSSKQISAILNINDLGIFIFYSFFVSLLLINIGPSAYLQGLLRFKAYAVYLSLGGLLRFIIFISTLLLIGISLKNVFFGMILALILVFICGLFFLKKNFTSHGKEVINYSAILKVSTYSFILIIGMTFLNNIDIILVKHYFDPSTAGVYAALVTVGKVFLFGAGVVKILMYPQISYLVAKKTSYITRFLQFLTLQVFILVSGMIIFFVFPKFIVATMFGEKFIVAADYLPLFILFIASYVLIDFLLMFLLAIEKTKPYILLILIIIFQITLITHYHKTISDIIYINTILTVCYAIILCIYIYFVIKNEKRLSISNSTSL